MFINCLLNNYLCYFQLVILQNTVYYICFPYADVCDPQKNVRLLNFRTLQMLKLL